MPSTSPQRDPVEEEIQRLDAPPLVDINEIIGGLGSQSSQTTRVKVPLTSPDAEAARARAKNLRPQIELRLGQSEQDALKLFEAQIVEVEAEGAAAKLTQDEIQARARAKDIAKNKLATDFQFDIMQEAIGMDVTENVTQLKKEVQGLKEQRQELEDTSVFNPLGKIINAVQVHVASERVKNVQAQISRGLQLQTEAMHSATTSAQALSALAPEAESTTLQAANQRLTDAKITVAKAQAGIAYDGKVAESLLTKYGLEGNELQQSLSLLSSINEGKRTAKADADAYLNTLRDWTELGKQGTNPAYIKMFSEKTGMPASTWLGMPAESRGMLINYWLGGQGALSNSPDEKELAAANSATSVLPDVLHRQIAGSLNRAIMEERKLGGGGTLLSKVTLDSATGKPIGGDLNRDKLFSTPIPMTIGGQYMGKASVPQLLEYGAFKKPGSAIGRALYAAPELVLFAESKKPGAAIVKNLLTKINGIPADKIPPTMDANSEIRFEDIRAIAKNNPAEIYGYFKEMQKHASMRVPYSFYGAAPQEIPLGMGYSYRKAGVLGIEDANGILRPRSVEDVINAMHRQDMGAGLQGQPATLPY